MDRFDPNQWTPEFVSENQAFCIEVLRDTNSTVVELVRRGQYDPAVAGLDRILNGLITLHNHAGGDYRSHICFFSWMEAEIIAFGVNAPADKRRETAQKLYEDARDYARSENTRNTIAAVLWDLKSGMSLEALQKRHDPDFPNSVVEVLADMNNKLAAGSRGPNTVSAPVRSAPTKPAPVSSGNTSTPASRSGGIGKGILIGLLIIICAVCLVIFLWGKLTEPKENSAPESSSTAGTTEASQNETTQPEATETSPETTGGPAADEVRIVKTASGSGLNLRMSPTTDSEVLTVIPDGSTVTVLSAEDGWANVTYEGETGWCSMDYLVTESEAPTQSPDDTAIVTTNGGELRLRTEPSLDAEVINGIPNGTAVTVLQQEGEWSYVDYDGTLGWCSSDYLTIQ